jgi:hypothetical protein
LRNRSEVALFVSGYSSGTGNFTPSSVSHLNYHEMQNHTFPAVFAGFRLVDARVSYEAAAERTIRVQFVTGSYFVVLGVDAQLGRVFSPADDRPEDTSDPEAHTRNSRVRRSRTAALKDRAR